MDRLTIPEAAEALGVTQSAVWQRIKRNTIRHEKDSEGKTYVFIELPVTGTDTVNEQSPNGLHDTLFMSMQDQIDTLKSELAIRNEELRRKDTIIMTMAQRIPELEPAKESTPEPRDAPETATGQRLDADPRSDGVGQETAKSRSWWRRFFGFN